ncbi:unnamed protein product [Adineta steineri]|uniref:PiggyBac transposable element-derived protein domain-containing protein n=1 Tax=Adineta steineri TaxID=433720 RepID=A0A813ZNY0_9BILA|nr:unnamed protein product [Adineta steineri]CAF0929637.1 unnamed protein product [Adineta steineri]
MTSVGVVEHRRSFVPNELKICRKQLHSSWFYFSESSMLLSYQAKEKKKPVIMLSSLHKYPETFDDDKILPCVIHDYNQTKCGVDVIDQCINHYTVRRITRRWPMIVFYNLIDIATTNAMTVWLCQNLDWNLKRSNTRRIFLTQLVKQLAHQQNQRRSEEARLKPKVKLALSSLGYSIHPESLKDVNTNVQLDPIKKRCYLCPANPGRKVRQTCNNCGLHVCLSHSKNITMVTCQTCSEK